MRDFEEKWIMNSPRFTPDTHRYVDDSKDTANEFLKYLNSRTIASISLMNSNKFSDVAQTTLSSHLSTGKRHSLDSIPNGIHLHHANTKSTSSAR